MLEGLHAHPILRDISLNTVIQYARLIFHLKGDILLPQPFEQSQISEPPEILPPSIAGFLAATMDIPTTHI